ncbi:MAG: response regulator [Planctomycetes bacterium]|nr:response regulator [Planctomycetota bacterium]
MRKRSACKLVATQSIGTRRHLVGCVEFEAAMTQRARRRHVAMGTVSALQIVVIEDDRDARENLRDILELDGYSVHTAATAEEALNRQDWSAVGAIVLDRRLPDATAEELLPRLKQAAPEAAVVIVTGYADLESAIAALRLGAADYIFKPINTDALRATLVRIVERKQMQEKLRQAERLAVIGQMVAGLAHESRNALQRSQACLEMLALEVEDRPAALDLVARVQKAQDDLQRLYEKVRSYAAPISLVRDRSHLGEILDDAWAALAPIRKGRQASLHWAAGDIDLHCQVDRFAIQQVLRNILENALAACPDAVEIQVHWSPAQLGGQPALRCTVRDNGPGLGAEAKQRIFEAFYTTKTHGTGLGMAIAQRIVEAHGGRIAAGDSPSPGAEIVVTLPRGGP